ncbi:hypothetical protein GCM10022288_15640 [Gryllotalpicola kribbensis]|uniref:Phage holin family protein n=1 Tax=Gryllotalpicola kribbensis TaxID=993084 RepID=A0ABP8ASC8_9MICO
MDTGTINFKGAWDTTWRSISGVIGPQVTGLMTIIGVLLVVFAVGKWIFDKRRGGGAASGLGPVLWALIAGALLAAPGVIIPAFLGILDTVINMLVHLVGSSGSAVGNTGVSSD